MKVLLHLTDNLRVCAEGPEYTRYIVQRMRTQNWMVCAYAKTKLALFEWVACDVKIPLIPGAQARLAELPDEPTEFAGHPRRRRSRKELTNAGYYQG